MALMAAMAVMAVMPVRIMARRQAPAQRLRRQATRRVAVTSSASDADAGRRAS
ncbi:MAG: hypothetical protein ACLGIO_14390 [Acidimicrobiia bacterium]